MIKVNIPLETQKFDSQIVNQNLTSFMSIKNIDISRYDDSFLNTTCQKRIQETHCKTTEEYATILEQNKLECELFLNSLQNCYSEFFRNSLSFSVLERIILPSLLRRNNTKKNKEIRIWSAACAYGHEAYSFAMLLEELISGYEKKPNYRIFATDQSESKVIEAQRGKYSREALNSLTMKRVKQWFTKNADTYTIKPVLKENIDFSLFDLFNNTLSCPPTSIFGNFDIVICANLLFYYKPNYRKAILEKATGCLAENGYIIVGEAERDILINYNFTEVFPQSGIFKNRKI